MGRPYAVKGRKKKRKLDEAAVSDAAPVTSDEVEELQSPPEEVREEDMAAMEGEEHVAAEGLPVVPRTVDGKRRSGAIFVLERACLEVGKVGKVRLAGLQQEISLFLRISFRLLSICSDVRFVPDVGFTIGPYS
jgi:hypothetical protein